MNHILLDSFFVFSILVFHANNIIIEIIEVFFVAVIIKHSDHDGLTPEDPHPNRSQIGHKFGQSNSVAEHLHPILFIDGWLVSASLEGNILSPPPSLLSRRT